MDPALLLAIFRDALLSFRRRSSSAPAYKTSSGRIGPHYYQFPLLINLPDAINRIGQLAFGSRTYN